MLLKYMYFSRFFCMALALDWDRHLSKKQSLKWSYIFSKFLVWRHVSALTFPAQQHNKCLTLLKGPYKLTLFCLVAPDAALALYCIPYLILAYARPKLWIWYPLLVLSNSIGTTLSIDKKYWFGLSLYLTYARTMIVSNPRPCGPFHDADV